MKRLALSLACLFLTAVPASSEEWWQDAFLSDQSTTGCLTSDSRVTFTASAAHYWEEGCTIRKTTPLKGLDAVILDMSCSNEDEASVPRRQVLLHLEDGKIASFPPLQVLKRCNTVDLNKPEAAINSECQFNSRLYRSALYGDENVASFQELQFTDGNAEGTVRLTEVRASKQVWTAHGEFACSNGASICRVTFPLAPTGTVDLPYEMVGDANADSEMVVIPAFRQEVYQIGQSADPAQGKHGGLIADLLGGFNPALDEVISPYNSYRYAECAK